MLPLRAILTSEQICGILRSPLVDPPHVAAQQRAAGKGFTTELDGARVPALLLVRQKMRLQIFRTTKKLLTHGTAVSCRTVLVLYMDPHVATQLGRRLKLRSAAGRLARVALAAIVRLLVSAENAGFAEAAAAAWAGTGEAGEVGLTALVGEQRRAGEEPPTAARNTTGECRLLLFGVKPKTENGSHLSSVADLDVPGSQN